jgi:predicted SnoaL-like aldol condensation-catalyzing enzyme
MSLKENKTVVLRFFEEMTTGDVERINEYVDENFITTNTWKDRNGLKKVIQDFRAAFDKMEFSLLDMIAEGDKVAISFRLTCTNRDHRKVITAVHIDRVVNGKIVEGFSCGDSFY